MRKIKVAQIGTSRYSHGINIFRSMALQKDLFEIVGYVLPENEREKFPDLMERFDGYREMTLDEVLNDPEIEAVAVETEEIYLTKYATLAVQQGKHIHMEKPGSVEPSEFEKLIQLVKEKNVVFHTGYMYRYNPYISKLIQRIKDGELGEIISVEAQMSGYHPIEQREWLKAFPGGMMFFLGCHLVDLVLQIQGMPKRIIPLNKSTGLDGLDSTDFGMAVFEYENGVSFVKTNDIERGGFLRRQLVVIGTKGTVEVKPLEENIGFPDLVTHYKEAYDIDWNKKEEKYVTEAYDRYDAMMASFAAMVRGEKENPWSCDYELQLYKCVHEACGEEV